MIQREEWEEEREGESGSGRCREEGEGLCLELLEHWKGIYIYSRGKGDKRYALLRLLVWFVSFC
jgi:hypothetical protein